MDDPGLEPDDESVDDKPVNDKAVIDASADDETVDEPDDALTHRVRQRDVDALADYIVAHRRQLLAYIHRRLGARLKQKIEADDILQEATGEAVRALPHSDLADRSPFSWLCHLAERKLIDAHRKYFGAQKRDAGKEQPIQGGADAGHDLVNLLVQSMTTPSQAFSRNARQERLIEAMSQLPEEQQTALRLRYVENRPSKEIARRLEKSDAAVRVMLTRSLKRLQQQLEG